MRSLPLLFTLLASATAAAADPYPAPDEKVQALVVYGSDPCPASDDGTIIVCARRPESERYRIPKALRGKAQVAEEQGWASRAQVLETASRASLPNSCTPVGTYGFTGCTLTMLQQWFAERRLDGKAPAAH